MIMLIIADFVITARRQVLTFCFVFKSGSIIWYFIEACVNTCSRDIVNISMN